MLNFASLLEFSHTHCVAICAVLVPLNLLATLGTMGLVGTQRPVRQIRMAVAVALLLALVMVLHVLTWFVIGVVRVPTYVLLGLGSLCLVMNLWAIAHGASMQRLLVALVQAGRQLGVRFNPGLGVPTQGEAKS
jgi:hypothetical protein